MFAIAAALAATVAGCSSSTSASTGTSTSTAAGSTITYWASDQGSSIADDYTVLNPELAKFTKQTGIKVKLEVIGWPDLLNRITAATASGQGPERGQHRRRFVGLTPGHRRPAAVEQPELLRHRRREPFVILGCRVYRRDRKAEAAVPLYSTAYALYYNKALFAQAGISGPPATWADLIADGKKLTHGSVYGLAWPSRPAASPRTSTTRSSSPSSMAAASSARQAPRRTPCPDAWRASSSSST